MVGRILLILTAFLAGCAQVKTLNGGPKDTYAPKIVAQTVSNGTTSFTGKSIELTFDEYFKLVNPAQTISIVPADAKISASYKKKKLSLNWQENLKENTTYIVTLNGTVKDLTEGNDSLMQIVFSTGNTIDSMHYSTRLIDADSPTPVKGLTVGLFTHPDSLQPLYFAQSGRNGDVQFQYVKDGTYYVRAFKDENRNMKIDPTERMGFLDKPIALNTADSIPIRVFQPVYQPKIRSVDVVSTGAVRMGANFPIHLGKVSINDKLYSPDEYLNYSTDSILVFHPFTESGRQQVVFSLDTIQDTLKTSLDKQLLEIPLKIESKGVFVPYEDVSFTCLAKTLDLDTSLVEVINLYDSSRVHNYTVELDKNQFLFDFGDDTVSYLLVTFEEGAVETTASKSNTQQSFQIQRKSEEDLGIINLDLTAYNSPLLLEIKKDNALIKTLQVTGGQIIPLEYLLPGNYSFSIILDANQNGRWDTGDFKKGLQPEEIHSFSEITKVRANWEVNVSLVPN